VRHPARVFAMILDSPLLDPDDIDVARRNIRSVLWHGQRDTEEVADKVRRLVDDGVMTPAAAQLAATVYGFGGARLLDRQLELLLGGRPLVWKTMGRLGELMVGRKAPYRNETDLVERIAFRELNYAADPDGLPLDPAVAMRDLAAGEPRGSRPNHTIWSPRCRNSAGRPWSSPAAGISSRRPQSPSGSPG
jgi:hypothetical protein